MQPPYFDSKTALDEAKCSEELNSTKIVRSNNNGLQCQLGWQRWEQPSDTFTLLDVVIMAAVAVIHQQRSDILSSGNYGSCDSSGSCTAAPQCYF